MKNPEIKKWFKDEHIYMWEVAKKLSIHESTFSKWFREELSKEQQKQIVSAVAAIQQDRRNAISSIDREK